MFSLHGTNGQHGKGQQHSASSSHEPKHGTHGQHGKGQHHNASSLHEPKHGKGRHLDAKAEGNSTCSPLQDPRVRFPSLIVPPRKVSGASVLIVVFSNRCNICAPKDVPTAMAWRINELYAARWGYTARLVTERVGPPQYHVAYQKMYAIKDGLREGFSTVVCLDDDGFINDHNTSVEQFTEALEHAGRDMLVPMHPAIGKTKVEVANTGLLMVRNTAWSRKFFEERFTPQWCYGSTHECAGLNCSTVDKAALQRQGKAHCCNMPCGEGCHEQLCLYRMMNANSASSSHGSVSQHIALMSAALLTCVPTHVSYFGRCQPWHVHMLAWTKLLIYPFATRWLQKGGRLSGEEMFEMARSAFKSNTRCSTWWNPLFPSLLAFSNWNAVASSANCRSAPFYHPKTIAAELSSTEQHCSRYRYSERFRCLYAQSNGSVAVYTSSPA